MSVARPDEEQMADDTGDRRHDPGWSSGQRRRLLETFTGVPATDGNRVDVLRDGEEIFPAMLDAIRDAERTVDFMTYVYWTGEITERFADALAERARAGVRVRVLLDSFGAGRMPEAQRVRMREAGVQLVWFRSFRTGRVWRANMRTHRRVLVCDEAVAFTGGVGIAREWVDGGSESGPPGWRDTHFRVRGPAVDGIHAAFLADWLETDNRVLGSVDRFLEHPRDGDSPVQVIRAASEFGWNAMAIAIQGLLELAEEHVRITSAYFRPPPAFREAMLGAASRGVQVDVLVPGPHAHPALHRWAGEYHYEELLEGGVDIWHYQPTMHHGKILTIDGAIAMVGTTNFDARSLAMNEQVGLIIHDPEVTGILDRHFTEDLRESLRVNATAWPHRRWSRRVREVVAHAATYSVRGAGAVR
jgi:cardiolipin synthase